MNLPNSLSLFRLVLVPVFVLVFFLGGEYSYVWAISVYILAEVTDCLDGYIARKFNKVTRLGRILDPLADKLMAFSAIVCIAVSGIVPWWAVLLFVIKEALMGLGALFMFKKIDDVMPSNMPGKVANVVFFADCVILMFDRTIAPLTAAIMISVALAVAYFAFFNYLAKYVAVLKKHRNKTGTDAKNT